jgi:hypothetical protein
LCFSTLTLTAVFLHTELLTASMPRQSRAVAQLNQQNDVPWALRPVQVGKDVCVGPLVVKAGVPIPS